jgi:hypothetical protein
MAMAYKNRVGKYARRRLLGRPKRKRGLILK